MYIPLKITKGEIVKMGTAIDTMYSKYGTREYKMYTPYPVISFRDKKSASDTGTLYTTTDDDPGSMFTEYKRGDEAYVSYYPKHPENARIYSFFIYWLRASTFCILILGCIVWLGIYYLMTKKYEGY